MKILVVGCGSIGRRHAENASAFAQTAVLDADRSKAMALGGTLGAIVFEDLRQALQWEPDGVVVATPHHTHIPIASAAVEAGAHVLVEKPLSHTPEGVSSFLHRAVAKGRKVFVVCNMRFHPAVMTLRSHLSEIGKPLFARAHYGNYLPKMRLGADYRELYCARREQGGGVILDAIHEIDYLLWFFGGAAAVQCESGKISDLDIDVEDIAEIAIRHLSGVHTQIHLDYLRPFKLRGCEICGTEGLMIWRSEGKAPEVCSVRLFRNTTGLWETVFFSENLDQQKPLRDVMAQFVDAISKGSETSLLTGQQAAMVLSVTLAAREAAASGQTIERRMMG